MTKYKISTLIGIIIGTVAAIALLGLFFQLLWNSCLVGTISGLKEISYLQGVGIVAFYQTFIKQDMFSTSEDK